MKRKIQSSENAMVLKSKTTKYFENKIDDLLYVESQISEIRDMYLKLDSFKHQIFNEIENLLSYIDNMNKDLAPFKNEILNEFHFELRNFHPVQLISLEILKDAFSARSLEMDLRKTFERINNAKIIVNREIKKNQENILPTPQMVSRRDVLEEQHIRLAKRGLRK
jgi:hypothetical protein